MTARRNNSWVLKSDNSHHLGGKWLNGEEILEEAERELAGRLAAAGAGGVRNKHNCFGQAGRSHQMMCFGLVHLSCSSDQHSAPQTLSRKHI